MQSEITIDLTHFTPLELANIERAASEKQMTLEQFVTFLISGVATPSR
jgi:hypothetical protein